MYCVVYMMYFALLVTVGVGPCGHATSDSKEAE